MVTIILKVKCHCLEKRAGWGDQVFLLGFNRAFMWSSLIIHLKPSSADKTFLCCVVLQCLYVLSSVGNDIFALYPLLLLGISSLPPGLYLLWGGAVSMPAGGVPEQKSESTYCFFLLLNSKRQRYRWFLCLPLCEMMLVIFSVLSYRKNLCDWRSPSLINLLHLTCQRLPQLAVQQGHHVNVYNWCQALSPGLEVQRYSQELVLPLKGQIY